MSARTEGLDCEARYTVKGWPAVAWFLLGWELEWEPVTFLDVDDDGNEFEEDSGEGEWVPNVGGQVVAVMVGDDQKHTFDLADLTAIGELDYCGSCGQVGCTADGRDRD